MCCLLQPPAAASAHPCTHPRPLGTPCPCHCTALYCWVQCRSCPYSQGWATCDSLGRCKACRVQDGYRLEGGKCTTRWVRAAQQPLHRLAASAHWRPGCSGACLCAGVDHISCWAWSLGWETLLPSQGMPLSGSPSAQWAGRCQQARVTDTTARPAPSCNLVGCRPCPNKVFCFAAPCHVNAPKCASNQVCVDDYCGGCNPICVPKV